MGLVRVVVLSNSSDLSRFVVRACFREFGVTIDGVNNCAVLRSGWRPGDHRTLLEAFHPMNEADLAAALGAAHAMMLVVDHSTSRAHEIAPLLDVAAEVLRDRASRGIPALLAIAGARQAPAQSYCDMLEATAELEVRWLTALPFFDQSSFADRAAGALLTLERALEERRRPSFDRPTPEAPRLPWSREQAFYQRHPVKSVAAMRERLLLGNTHGELASYSFGDDGRLEAPDETWRAALVAGPFGRTPHGRVSLTEAGALVYVRDGTLTSPMAVDLPVRSPVAFDVHGAMLVVADERGTHAFELIDEDVLDEPRLRARWSVPARKRFDAALGIAVVDVPHSVTCVADGRALIDTVTGARLLVDGRAGEHTEVAAPGTACDRAFAFGRGRERALSIGSQGVSLLHRETFLPVEVTPIPMLAGTDPRVVPSTHESFLLVYTKSGGAVVLRASTFATELCHRPASNILCCDWIDDGTAVIVHELGVDLVFARSHEWARDRSLPPDLAPLAPVPMLQAVREPDNLVRVVLLCSEETLAARAIEGVARLPSASVARNEATVPAWWAWGDATVCVQTFHSVHEEHVAHAVGCADALLLVTDANDWRAAKLEPIVRVARHACDARAAAGEPVPFASVLIAQDGAPRFRDLLPLMSVLTVRWLPEGPTAETYAELGGMLRALIEGLARGAVREGTTYARSRNSHAIARPTRRHAIACESPPSAIAATQRALLLGGPAGPLEAFAIDAEGVIDAHSSAWATECIEGAFGRTAFGRVSVTPGGSLLYLHADVIERPSVCALADTAVAFDCHANVLAVADSKGLHAFDLVEGAPGTAPEVYLRWSVPHSASELEGKGWVRITRVQWLSNERVLVERSGGDRHIVDGRRGTTRAPALAVRAASGERVFTCGSRRERIYAVDPYCLSKLDPETFAPIEVSRHRLKATNVRALPSPSGRRVLLMNEPSRVAVANADTLAIEREHRPDGDLYCADWIDDDTVAIAHSSGVDTLLLRVPLA